MGKLPCGRERGILFPWRWNFREERTTCSLCMELLYLAGIKYPGHFKRIRSGRSMRFGSFKRAFLLPGGRERQNRWARGRKLPHGKIRLWAPAWGEAEAWLDRTRCLCPGAQVGFVWSFSRSEFTRCFWRMFFDDDFKRSFSSWVFFT